MKGGCFGKILVFIFGVIVGFVLFAGTIAGAGYYLVTQVTVNDVENVAQTEFTFIDSEAEIRDKSLYDIFKLVSGGDIKNITVKDAKTTFGIDVIDILEKSLEITIREDGKADLENLPILQVFQGDNLKIVLNSISLNDVLTKAGIDKDSLDEKPLISDHYGDPVIDALNAILGELNFNALKIGDMEYLIGLSLGNGILDNLKNYTVNDINNAINDVTFENILPNFDRDYYYQVSLSDGEYVIDTYFEDGYEQICFTPAYVLIAEGEEINASERYSMNEDGIMSQADDGIYKLNGTLPLIEDIYAKSGDVYTQNRNGIMKVADGTAVSDRYIKNEDNTYTQNDAGTYKKKFTTLNNGGTKYVYRYVKNFVESEEGSKVYVLEQRELVALDTSIDLSSAQKLVVLTTVEGEGENAKTTNQLVNRTAETSAQYVFAHSGASERILQALADMTLNNLDGRIGTLTIGDVIDVTNDSSKILIALKDTPIDKLGVKVGSLKLNEVMEITAESSKLLQQLQDTEIDNLSTAIDNLKLKDIIDVKEKNIVTAAADGEYISLPAIPAGKAYKGSFIEAYTTADSEESILLVKYIEGIDAVGAYFEGQSRYTLPAENKASSGILVSMADVTVKELSNMEDIIMQSVLGKVIDIDGDVFVTTDYTAYSAVPAAEISDMYVYFDATEDIMRGIENTDESAVIYKKIYSGKGNAIIKKMAGIKINNIAARTQVVINETKLSEVITVQKNNVLTSVADGLYIALPEKDSADQPYTYIGNYKTGLDGNKLIKIVKYQEGIDAVGAVCEGMQRYEITTTSSNAVLSGLADKKIKDMTGDMQSVINNSVLSDVIDIDGDAYRLTAYTNYADVPETERKNLYVFADENYDIMRTIDETDVTAVIYEKVYTGTDTAIIKKMAGIKISNISARIQTVINETRLDEVLTVQKEYIVVADASGEYISLPDGEYFGTYNEGRIKDTDTHIKFVKATASVDINDASNFFYGQSFYSLETEISNGVLIQIANLKIGDLSSSMPSVVNNTMLSDVLDISGNVYKKLNAITYESAVEEAFANSHSKLFYHDESGLYLTAGYFRAKEGYYVFEKTDSAEGIPGTDEGSFVPYAVATHNGWQRYNFEGETNLGGVITRETEYYVQIYSGTSNSVLRKLATISMQALNRDNTINKAVEESTLSEIGIAPATDDGSILYRLKDCRISEMSYAIEDLLSTATLRDLNRWGNLGMSETTMIKLNTAVYFDYCAKNAITPDASYDGTDPAYDITAVEFFSGLQIDGYDTTTGNVKIVWSRA